MTFTQLRAFALVAELGSLRAAAAALGVSEPAVSAAVSALRSDLGDPLFRRTGTGIALTPGGRALAVRARELVRLAERTRREVATATSTDRLRVLATPSCAEHVAGAVLDAFTRRVAGAGIELTTGSTDCAATALADGDADVVLGVRPAPAPGQVLEPVPFLRYRRVVVAAPGHPLAPRTRLRVEELAAARWLTGPAGLEPGSEEERWAAAGGSPPDVERCESEAAALAAVLRGRGVLLALAHAVRERVARGALVRLPVEGTPVSGLWWATVPGEGRAVAAARALQRFLTTPDATSALLARPERRDRPRPTVRVELWS
ncbi:LysR family transcriptional regulator [Blastococcus sp. MG754426]|uniref:LysR family transcriptional regulator n=1 Tax=unclassified Blastococcus TaxID=2619396 RepID=UPI001EEFB097|nr:MULTISPECIES: LysR family transcriptional regulator [unclassified Blastococcus]MCF6508095.1 LysR family transcriptional regulator [Blastococcus sp. MG754426]MCF6511576.1 LysR family transcriptional regulator [Blastococcus sp. MG754427]MCF6733739.1 LysR family transcriptional regulator [Blastococcus sp. KM273129]